MKNRIEDYFFTMPKNRNIERGMRNIVMNVKDIRVPSNRN
jgi:hypothetical protein